MEAMQLMPVHRTNMLMQTFNQPKFEVETPVETIETEIISSRREKQKIAFYRSQHQRSHYTASKGRMCSASIQQG